MVSWTGQFRVIGPGHPIRALVGDEAELPCRIYPGKNATGMEVGWYRPPFSRVVHLYRNGKDQDAEQAPEYRGRTELLKEAMGEGKVTLRIRNVRFSDEGGFTCFFRDHSYQEEAAMELRVEGECLRGATSLGDWTLSADRPPYHSPPPLRDRGVHTLPAGRVGGWGRSRA